MSFFFKSFLNFSVFSNSDPNYSEYSNCSASFPAASLRRLFSIPSLTSVDDGELVSFVLSTFSLSSNYRQLKGTNLGGVTSVKLMPSNISVTIISISSDSLFVQFPVGIGMDYAVSLFVGSAEYSSSSSLASAFSYQRNCISLIEHYASI